MGYMTFIKGMHQSERERYVNKKAWLSWEWYGGSQWCILHRKHVELLIEHWAMIVATFDSKKEYAPDEHVYPIFFNAFCQKESFHPSAMFVDWSPSINCSIGHRATPKTYHDEDLVEEPLRAIYESGALFLRKVCVLTKLNYDWTQARPLQPLPPRKKTTFVIKSRAKAGAR